MSNFNPYHEWLGLDPVLADPNHYQLFSLAEFESDPQTISQAADRAVSQVRSFRPGVHSAVWAELLDRMHDAKTVLLDPTARAQYDQAVKQNASAAPVPAAPAPIPTEPAAVNPMYPPGMAGNPTEVPANNVVQPATPQGSVPVLEAATPVSPAPQPAVAPTPVLQPAPVAPTSANPMQPTTPIQPAATIQPTAPIQTNPMQPSPMQPVAPASPFVANTAVPAAQPGMVDPMAPMPTQPVAVAPAAVDPMAPVALDPMAPASPVQPATPNPMDPMAPSPAPAMVQAGSAPSMLAPNPALANDAPAVQSNTSAAKAVVERQQSAMQTPVMIGMGVGIFLLFAAGVYFATQAIGTNDTETGETQVAENTNPPEEVPPEKPPSSNITPPAIRPNPPIQNNDPPSITPPRPTPTVTPPPMPEPVPTPTPTPTPPPPPTVTATPEELKALSDALTMVRVSLSDRDYDTANQQIAKAEQVAKVPEHKAMVGRLKKVVGHVNQFWDAVKEDAGKLEGLEEFQIKDEIVVIVEVKKDFIKYRVRGDTVTRAPNRLPDLLAVKVAELALTPNDSQTRIILGAFFSSCIERNSDYAPIARQLWQEASAGGAEADELLEFLNDDYSSLSA